MKKCILSWSGGKDSAWALKLLREQNEWQVGALLTTVNEHFHRIAIHGVREELLDRQAAAAGLPLWKVPLPWPCPNEEYELRMAAVCQRAIAEGFEAVAFGDLFLEEIRAYRERMLTGTGLQPLFPVWGIPTDLLAEQMLVAGVKARIACLDPRKLPAELAGKQWSRDLIASLPTGVDPCGENGEFHTFVSAGPMLSREIAVTPGEVLEREGFVYAELLG
ncbi:adenine nucleotide alpha hydrolase [Terriglobus tenax]|uniref:adenine nucleotide alpha hydrolase n=1 Tax=Terriglobus tenax TaxID=1111115 RepID=UPI0021E0B3FC|nr:adenine nucleotide alpha hydrolase [Terriglobus tenax]